METLGGVCSRGSQGALVSDCSHSYDFDARIDAAGINQGELWFCPLRHSRDSCKGPLALDAGTVINVRLNSSFVSGVLMSLMSMDEAAIVDCVTVSLPRATRLAKTSRHEPTAPMLARLGVPRTHG